MAAVNNPAAIDNPGNPVDDNTEEPEGLAVPVKPFPNGEEQSYGKEAFTGSVTYGL